MTAPLPSTFSAVVQELRALLAPYAPPLVVTADGPGGYSLDAPSLAPNGKPLFFGGVQARKGYVSFYFMPVYMYPELLDGLSPALRARMQGKSCFNFKMADRVLAGARRAELAALVERGFRRLEREGLLAAGAGAKGAKGASGE
jgi:hypothetical protein